MVRVRDRAWTNGIQYEERKDEKEQQVSISKIWFSHINASRTEVLVSFFLAGIRDVCFPTCPWSF